jgi:hypothetical protein
MKEPFDKLGADDDKMGDAPCDRGRLLGSMMVEIIARFRIALR